MPPFCFSLRIERMNLRHPDPCRVFSDHVELTCTVITAWGHAAYKETEPV